MDNARLLNLYFSLIAMEFISLLFGLEFLHILSNLLAVPLVLFIYLRIVKLNYKWYFILMMIALYSTDIYHLTVKLELNNLFCAYLNTAAYVILTFFIVKNMEFKRLKDLDYIFYLSFIIVFCFYLYILYVANEILLDQKIDNYIIILIYALFMFVMSILITIKYMLKPNISNTSLQISVACFIISDVFYLITIIYNDITVFKYLFLIPQLTVYYFLLKYELNRNKIFEIK